MRKLILLATILFMVTSVYAGIRQTHTASHFCPKNHNTQNLGTGTTSWGQGFFAGTVRSTAAVIGTLTVGTISQTGATTVGGTLGVTGVSTLTGNVYAVDDVQVKDRLTVGTIIISSKIITTTDFTTTNSTTTVAKITQARVTDAVVTNSTTTVLASGDIRIQAAGKISCVDTGYMLPTVVASLPTSGYTPGAIIVYTGGDSYELYIATEAVAGAQSWVKVGAQ